MFEYFICVQKIIKTFGKYFLQANTSLCKRTFFRNFEKFKYFKLFNRFFDDDMFNVKLLLEIFTKYTSFYILI